METQEYSKFKFLKTNREINPHNVERIKASIEEWGIIPGRPILVDKDYNIIDGQHRFVAIKELELPVQYEYVDGDVIGKTMALNSNQQHWLAIDYVRSFAASGNLEYQKVLEFHEKYNFGFTSSLYI
jgi:hypothetical protein